MRDYLRSHFILFVAIFLALPFALWGAIVVADLSTSVLPIKASPLEDARSIMYDVERRLPWGEGWAYYTTIGGELDVIGASFAYPRGAEIEELGAAAVAVTLDEENEPALIVGNASLAGFQESEILDSGESKLKGYRLRELQVQRTTASREYPSWWIEEHRFFVVDVNDTRRVSVAVSPDFKEVQRFLDSLSWQE